jgi:lupus La protein
VQNLSTDKHLFFELEGPKNRPVSIKHLNTFSRMRRFKPYSAVVDALRESEDLVVVDDGEYSGAGNEAVKRTEALVVPTRPGDDENPPSLEELFERMMRASINKMENCVYVKGFVDEGEEVGQIALEAFFKTYGALMVRKRRNKEDNSFKGSVFVEFDNEESQKQFLELDPKPKFNGRDLTIMSKKEYSEMKCKEKGITPAWLRDEEYNSSRRSNGRERGRGDHRGRGRGRGDSRGRGRGGRGGRYNDKGRNDRSGRDRDGDRRRNRSHSRSSEDSRDWNKRRDRFQKKEERKPVEKDENGIPVVKDTRTAEETNTAKKRKADDSEPADGVKKTKIEIKEDE